MDLALHDGPAQPLAVVQDQVGDPQNFREVWSAQIFRSIDSSSAAGLPRTKQALKMGLSAQKGNIVDFSIQVMHSSTHHWSAVQGGGGGRGGCWQDDKTPWPGALC